MTREAIPKLLIVYATPSEKEPFTDWLNGLRNVVGRKRILAQIARLEQGNYGDCEPVGEEISELAFSLNQVTRSRQKDFSWFAMCPDPKLVPGFCDV